MTAQYQPLTRQERSKHSAPVLIAFVEVCADWLLEQDEELAAAGVTNADEYTGWCLSAINEERLVLPERLLVRMNSVVGIDLALRKLLPRVEDRIHWLRHHSNGPLCKGRAPISIITETEEFHLVELRERVDDWMDSIFVKPNPVIRTGSVPSRNQIAMVDRLLNSLGL